MERVTKSQPACGPVSAAVWMWNWNRTENFPRRLPIELPHATRYMNSSHATLPVRRNIRFIATSCLRARSTLFPKENSTELKILCQILFFFSGDLRANQNPQLTILHIMLLREHNRVADYLANLNLHWTDETIFQETRRILIAEHQNIAYYEWLPIFLGSNISDLSRAFNIFFYISIMK